MTSVNSITALLSKRYLPEDIHTPRHSMKRHIKQQCYTVQPIKRDVFSPLFSGCAACVLTGISKSSSVYGLVGYGSLVYKNT